MFVGYLDSLSVLPPEHDTNTGHNSSIAHDRYLRIRPIARKSSCGGGQTPTFQKGPLTSKQKVPHPPSATGLLGIPRADKKARNEDFEGKKEEWEGQRSSE